MKKELIILSGFLGTGKTTILKYLLESSSNLKLRVLLNDFGDVPVDGALIGEANTALEIIEIGGGSVFCSCLKEQFVKALHSLAHSNAERIIVEASGMSDPTGITKTLSLAKLNDYYQNPTILCLFDPQRSLKLSNVLEVIPRQVKAAHIAILTKSDITTVMERKQSREYIEKINPNIPIVESYNGLFDLSAEFDNTTCTALSLLSFNTPETRLDSFTFNKEINDIDLFIETLKSYDEILRIKGCVKYKGIWYFIEDSPEGIIASEKNMKIVPLTVICMPNKGEDIQYKLNKLAI